MASPKKSQPVETAAEEPTAVVATQGNISTGRRKPQVEELPGGTTRVSF